MKKLYNYRNGNYEVTIYEDGTKIRKTNDSEFVAEFPDSADVKLTNYCDLSSVCVYCHEKSNTSGGHGDLSLIEEAWKDLPSGVELACGGGDTLSHPDVVDFARQMTRSGKIINITCNQLHLERYENELAALISNDYIKGLGISLRNVFGNIPLGIFDYNNTIFHCIAGIDTADTIDHLIGRCNKPKILLLGYKNFGNGKLYLRKHEETIAQNIRELYNRLPIILDNISKKDGTLSFDNLAIEQLNPRRILSESDYNKFYQGEDGKNTFYVDVVTKTFARNSTSTERFPLINSARKMFKLLNS